MLLYHGSNAVVHTPEIRPHMRAVDFGVGFYTTAIINQAMEWAHKKTSFSGGDPIVSVYFVDDRDVVLLNTRSFRGASEAWLDFVIKYRRGTAGVYSRTAAGTYWRGKGHHKYDLVIGEMADDTTTIAIDAYLSGKRSREWLLQELKFKKRSDQHVFSSPRAVGLLQYAYMYCLHRGTWVKNTKR